MERRRVPCIHTRKTKATRELGCMRWTRSFQGSRGGTTCLTRLLQHSSSNNHIIQPRIHLKTNIHCSIHTRRLLLPPPQPYTSPVHQNTNNPSHAQLTAAQSQLAPSRSNTVAYSESQYSEAPSGAPARSQSPVQTPHQQQYQALGGPYRQGSLGQTQGVVGRKPVEGSWKDV